MRNIALVSVIIPIYNAEKHLHKCINSILNQTYNNIECILVNDGSSDLSGEICNHFSQTDERIKVIHQNNAGVSAARNTGLDTATGDWVMFIDSDDWIELYSIDKALKLANKFNADVVGFNISAESECIQEDKNPDLIIRDQRLSKYFIIDTMVPYYDKKKNNVEISITNIRSSCAKIYSNKLYSNLRFTEGLALGEDMLFCILAYLKASKIVFFNENLYHYTKNTNSAMHQYRPNISETNNTIYSTLDKINFNNFNTLEYKLFNLGIIYECLYNELNFNVNHSKNTLSLKEKYNYLNLTFRSDIYINCKKYFLQDVTNFLPLHQKLYLYLLKKNAIRSLILFNKTINFIKSSFNK